MSLGTSLMVTIKNLEAIRDSQDKPNPKIIALLDDLYQKSIALIEANIDNTTKQYEDATAAMDAAASTTNQAMHNLANVADTINTVATAIDLITKLLKV